MTTRIKVVMSFRAVGVQGEAALVATHNKRLYQYTVWRTEHADLHDVICIQACWIVSR